MKKSIFRQDLYRYYGDRKETLMRRVLRPLELKYICALRKAQESSNVFSRVYYKMRLRALSLKTHIQIPVSTKIGAGFYIGHTGE